MNRLPPDFSTQHTPKELGYRFPAEWEPHDATWLSWPHRTDSFPNILPKIYEPYSRFVAEIAKGERVCINVNDHAMERSAKEHLSKAGADLTRIEFFFHPTNDAWCRDHGPAFLVRKEEPQKALVGWKFNAWGGKYPHDLDEQIPLRISLKRGLPCFTPPLVMEGGSVEFNGEGTVLTTKSCLLSPSRNPHLDQKKIEEALRDYYCVDRVLWLDEGITGDDTDGHIDDLTRFVSKDSVVTMIAPHSSHPDYEVLKKNGKELDKMGLNVFELKMPSPYEELPCSYANFYLCNAAVIVPTFEDPHDEAALELLSRCFPDRDVVGISSKEIIWGLGSFHCLSQQEPKVLSTS
jgi:agmatine deiminase